MRRAVIIANGELHAAPAARALAQAADVLIAADGGAQHCRALGLTPHFVVGDLDSLAPDRRAELERAGVRFEVHPARKDETDLELAVLVALREGAEEAVLLAALGARWDQSLANILLLAHPAFAPLRLRLVDGSDTLWIIRDRAVVQGRVGDRLSLLPLGGDVEGVTLTGLEYPLTDSLVRFGHTIGISNVLVAPEAVISIQRGVLLAIHTRIFDF
jgi:thiamine pyrophosphokinase